MATITNQEWNNLFNCLMQLPGTLIQVNVGTIADPIMVQRGWTHKHIALFKENRNKLEKHNSLLVEKQQYLDGLKKKSISKVIAQATVKKTVKKETGDAAIQNLTELIDQHTKLLAEKVELPKLQLIPASEVEKFEFTGNTNIGAFWEWLVDDNK